MCGIVGAVRARPGTLNIEAAVACLSHRGPDDQGVWREGEAELGFRRLSIIDVGEGGHQPMASPDDRYVIVFNGEIYNFPDLRRELGAAGESFKGRSDTEVLLRVFMREGLERCLAKLRGMFAFAIWDRQERRLSLARDRLGVKPLVYAATARGFAFASEIAALFELDPELSRDPDLQAIDHYLTLNYVPAPMSAFSAIRKLPPAHAMVVREGRVERIFRYWDIDASRRSNLSFAEACEALREQFLEATRIRLVSDVPLGAFLSGGIDSSITVAAMSRLGTQPPETFSIGFDDERFNELPFAREVAAHLGTRHREMVVRPDAFEVMPGMIDRLGEPMADNSVMPTYYVSRFAREHVTVALTGDGGDESFAGYRRFYQMRRADWLERARLVPGWQNLRKLAIGAENLFRPERRRRGFPATRADEMLGLAGAERYKHLIALYTDLEKAALVTPQFAAAAGALAGGGASGYLRERLQRPGEDPLNRYLYTELTSYLPEDILFKVDAASMAVSLECRSPFLDHKLVEFAASLPGRYKMTAFGRHKHILKEAFAHWLPRGFMDRPKKGFSVPLGRWLRDDLGDVMRETLVGRRTLAPWIRQDAVNRMVEDHLAGRASHPMKLWSMLVLGLWIERFRVPT
jgi:asparagine synthase (glutamine-hydrolysing)